MWLRQVTSWQILSPAHAVSTWKEAALHSCLHWLTPACLQVLFSELGFVYLDVRPPLELDEVGKVRGSVNIPIMRSQRKWSPEEQKKVVKKVWSAPLPTSSCLATDDWQHSALQVEACGWSL